MVLLTFWRSSGIGGNPSFCAQMNVGLFVREIPAPIKIKSALPPPPQNLKSTPREWRFSWGKSQKNPPPTHKIKGSHFLPKNCERKHYGHEDSSEMKVNIPCDRLFYITVMIFLNSELILSRDAACNLERCIDSMWMSSTALTGSRLQGHECKRKTA